MSRAGLLTNTALAAFALICSSAFPQRPAGGTPPALAPARMPRAGRVSSRFLSYNIEMVEVTGGRFWKPYKTAAGASLSEAAAPVPRAAPAGLDPALFEYRPPINLSNARLRRLAAALGPAYVRVSGTWANSVYFHDASAPAPQRPPAGFNGILTRSQWKGVIDFARAAGADLVTSFATSAGARDEAGVWAPAQAQRLLAYTKLAGGRIAAAEFMNEPNLAAMGGAPPGYDAAAYARDAAVFRAFLKKAAPDAAFLGPGSVGEGAGLALPPRGGILKSEDLLAATGLAFDVFSYHLYGAVSQRCAGFGATSQIAASDALSPAWFERASTIHDFYAALRDRFLPGKPVWLTETADAACGGNPWASTFLDTFRFLDQHGRLARRGVQVIAHNTLAASDYGLLDEQTFTPRPNYWAALVWRRLMGPTVLDPGPAPAPDVYLYAHCLHARPGGVALLVINASRDQTREISLPVVSERYTLTANSLQDRDVELNGATLQLAAGDTLPAIAGKPAGAGSVSLPPASITFLAIPRAGNPACR